MRISTDDLLKPRKKVFLKQRRRPGALVLLLGAVTVAVLTLTYAAHAGRLLPHGLAMLGVGLVGAWLVPTLLALRARAAAPRVFAGVNTAAALLLFTVLGAPTDRALAENGQAPFVAVAELLGPEAPQARHITDLGGELVSLLRGLTLRGGAPSPEGTSAPPLQAALDDARSVQAWSVGGRPDEVGRVPR